MKISVGVGGTFSLGEESREFIRPSIEIADVDPDEDIEEQLKRAKLAIDKVWSEAIKILLEKLERTLKNPKGG